MQFRLLSAFLIFIGSYFPLAIILAVQDISENWWMRPLCTVASWNASECIYMPFDHPTSCIGFIIVTASSVIFANISFKKISYRYQVTVNQVKAIPNEIINYTFPYVVSFMGISYGEPQKLLGFAVFLLWMFAISYKSGQILMNPLLIIFKWRLYEASIQINGQTREVRILKQGLLVPGPQKAETIQDFYITRD